MVAFLFISSIASAFLAGRLYQQWVTLNREYKNEVAKLRVFRPDQDATTEDKPGTKGSIYVRNERALFESRHGRKGGSHLKQPQTVSQH